MNKQSLAYTIIFTFLVSFVFVLLLAVADQSTRAQVALNQQISRQRAILNALNIPADTPEEVLSKYEDVETVEIDGVELYRTTVEGTTVYGKEFSGSGLWGTITGVLAVTESVDSTVGIEIISQNETPGLGARIDEQWFKRQFRGEKLVDGRILVTGGGDGDYDHDNGRIDAITGASRTSDSMQVILDRELESLSTLLEVNS